MIGKNVGIIGRLGARAVLRFTVWLLCKWGKKKGKRAGAWQKWQSKHGGGPGANCVVLLAVAGLRGGGGKGERKKWGGEGGGGVRVFVSSPSFSVASGGFGKK